MDAFFRSSRRRQPASEWSLEEAARFAALKEGYLLQFLSKHKGALATARRLGLSQFQPQPLSPSVAQGGRQRHQAPRPTSAGGPSAAVRGSSQGGSREAARRASRLNRHPPSQTSASTAASSAAPAEDTGRVAADTGSGAGDSPALQPNANKRRSAARSARRHAERQRAIRSRILAVLYLLRLRRRARLRRDLADLESVESLPLALPSDPTSKRGRASSSDDSAASSSLQDGECCGGSRSSSRSSVSSSSGGDAALLALNTWWPPRCCHNGMIDAPEMELVAIPPPIQPGRPTRYCVLCLRQWGGTCGWVEPRRSVQPPAKRSSAAWNVGLR